MEQISSVCKVEDDAYEPMIYPPDLLSTPTEWRRSTLSLLESAKYNRGQRLKQRIEDYKVRRKNHKSNYIIKQCHNVI